MIQETRPQARPDYGLDAGARPGPRLSARRRAPIALGLALRAWVPYTIATTIRNYPAVAGRIFFVEGILMFWSSRYGKLHERDRLLDRLNLRGDEAVLDVGPGPGLLLIGRRTPAARARCRDHRWSQQIRPATAAPRCWRTPSSKASPTALRSRWRYAPDAFRRRELRRGRREPGHPQIFDDRDGREQAIHEIVRVLEPGGKVALLDFQHVGDTPMRCVLAHAGGGCIRVELLDVSARAYRDRHQAGVERLRSPLKRPRPEDTKIVVYLECRRTIDS